MTERSEHGRDEGIRRLERDADKMVMASWVHSLAPWEVIAHLTFRWEVSLDAARRGYERFMHRSLPHLSYFHAEEQNPSRDGYHVHALWADCKTLYRREAWSKWFKRFGRARIEPVRSKGDVADYCSKYVTKEGSWWNVSLQWHRSQALRRQPFTLERDSPVTGYAPLPVPVIEFPCARDVFNLAPDPSPAGVQSIQVAPVEDPRQTCLFRDRGDGVWERCL